MNKEKRKLIETGVLEFVSVITKGGGNKAVYTSLFSSLNDKQFDLFWESIKEKGYIPVFLDNYNNDEMVDIDLMNKLSKKWSIPLEQQVVIPDPDTGISYTTPQTAMVGICEVSKQRQLVSKKIGVSKNDYRVDDLTGQPTGDSKAGGISNPEINILIALGLTVTAKELATVKGGDINAYRFYKSQLINNGNVTTRDALKNGNGVKSLKTAQWLLLGRHIQTNIGSRA